MLVNLTDVFASEGNVIEKSFPLQIDTLTYEGETYAIREHSEVSLKLSNISKNRALIEAEAVLKAVMFCDRCLSEVEHTFNLQFSREAVAPDSAKEEDLEEQEGFMEGYELDIDGLIQNEIMTCWPVKILCREDCKGLCPVCGTNLNTGSCDCDTFVPDPRMAAIFDVFNTNKEV